MDQVRQPFADELAKAFAENGVVTAEDRPAGRPDRLFRRSESSGDLLRQLLRPRLGLRPWLAFLRRALAFCLLVRFDIVLRVAGDCWDRCLPFVVTGY